MTTKDTQPELSEEKLEIINDLTVFIATSQYLSFSEAARDLGTSRGYTSRKVASLEKQVGATLFERSTRKVGLTEEGRRLLDLCRGPLDDLLQAIHLVEPGWPGRIRITAPAFAARTMIAPRLLDFAVQYPSVKLELTTTERGLSFSRDNIDLALMLGPLRDPEMKAIPLWSVPYCFCAGRGFMERHGMGERVKAQRFLSLPAITSHQSWILDSGEHLSPKNPVHEFDDLDVVAAAVARDLGVAMLPREMATGDVVPLEVMEAEPMSRQMLAVYPTFRLLPARLRALIAMLKDDTPTEANSE
ncbi:LysR family transcriptional regulator [Sagittula sp. S175]|uniref:LysR family transcriptional regulator n=1 Tax=Sagittula sp. S175 TaxID=3415129 RepID=UPI003C7BD697